MLNARTGRNLAFVFLCLTYFIAAPGRSVAAFGPGECEWEVDGSPGTLWAGFLDGGPSESSALWNCEATDGEYCDFACNSFCNKMPYGTGEEVWCDEDTLEQTGPGGEWEIEGWCRCHAEGIPED